MAFNKKSTHTTATTNLTEVDSPLFRRLKTIATDKILLFFVQAPLSWYEDTLLTQSRSGFCDCQILEIQCCMQPPPS